MEKIVSFHDKYKIYDDANIYIYDKLINKKKMHYILLKKHISSVGHSSSQKSESLNSYFKGFGTLNSSMRSWNIFQLMTWLDRCV